MLPNQNPTSMNRNIIKIILPLLFIFFQFGCQDSKQDESKAIQAKQNFNIVTTDANFKSLSSSEQWEYIIEIVKTPYKNSEEVEKWLLKKWNTNSFKVEALDEAVLGKINVALYHSDYSIFAKKIALFTIYSDFGKTNTKAHGTAAAILLSEYNFHKQKDSLKLYFNLADLNGKFFDAYNGSI